MAINSSNISRSKISCIQLIFNLKILGCNDEGGENGGGGIDSAIATQISAIPLVEVVATNSFVFSERTKR